jgi:hypothetical protein
MVLQPVRILDEKMTLPGMRSVQREAVERAV